MRAAMPLLGIRGDSTPASRVATPLDTPVFSGLPALQPFYEMRITLRMGAAGASNESLRDARFNYTTDEMEIVMLRTIAPAPSVKNHRQIL